MNQKKCLKCGQTTSYSGAVPLECSACGAIYQKVEAARNAAVSGEPSRPLERPTERAAPRASTPKRSTSYSHAPEHKAFAEVMRSESLYPTWREIVKWITFFWYAVAALGLIGTAIGSGMGKSTFIALFVAILIVIFARAAKELSLMLTDLADAAVRMAADKEKL